MNRNYEQRKEYFRQRYLANKERLLEQSKQYQKANPEVARRAQDRYKKRHAEAIRAKRRASYQARKEKERAIHKRWVANNKESRAAYMKSWRAKNTEVRKLYDRAYAAAHREQRTETQNARRARQIGNGGTHTKEQWLSKKAEYNECCAYCGWQGRLTKDHVTPLARGGTDDISNIVPACLPCNRRKHVKSAEEFRACLPIA